MGVALDLIGQKFGRLEVISSAGRRNGRRRWCCRCVCNEIAEVALSDLRSGAIRSCGCLAREIWSSAISRRRCATSSSSATYRRRCASSLGRALRHTACAAARFTRLHDGTRPLPEQKNERIRDMVVVASNSASRALKNFTPNSALGHHPSTRSTASTITDTMKGGTFAGRRLSSRRTTNATTAGSQLSVRPKACPIGHV